jgi:hypothetical protein
MNFNQIVINDDNIGNFVSKNYQKVAHGYINPIYPYQVNYIAKDCDGMFDTIPVVGSWALMKDTLFTFYIMLKDDFRQMRMNSIISKYCGPPLAESNVEINYNGPSGNIYYWKYNKLEVTLEKFINVRNGIKYENCGLLIIGNMKYRSLLPSLGDSPK